MNRKWIQRGFLLTGVILIVISAISCIFGFRIREIWPATVDIYEIGIPYIIGFLGVIFLSFGLLAIYYSLIAKEKIIE